MERSICLYPCPKKNRDWFCLPEEKSHVRQAKDFPQTSPWRKGSYAWSLAPSPFKGGIYLSLHFNILHNVINTLCQLLSLAWRTCDEKSGSSPAYPCYPCLSLLFHFFIRIENLNHQFITFFILHKEDHENHCQKTWKKITNKYVCHTIFMNEPGYHFKNGVLLTFLFILGGNFDEKNYDYMVFW